MTDYEHIVVSAVRYALGRMTYIVELTVNYVLEEIENDELSDRCLDVIAEDIRSAKSLGMDCDKAHWLKLLNRIEEVIWVTKEQEKAIENLEDLLKQRNEKQVQITTYDLFGNIETVLSLIKDQTDRINYLENNRKQVKEQVEAAQLELGFAIDMLTDV